MGKILVTRIACLGLAAYIFKETIYREKLVKLKLQKQAEKFKGK